MSTPSWRDVLPVHPAANLFPMMTAGEMQELVDDIKRNGQKLPVWLFIDGDERQLLDGRNRLDAMEAAGIAVIDEAGELSDEVWVNCISREDGDDPFKFALAANLHRRNLTAEQKRDVVAKILKAKPDAS